VILASPRSLFRAFRDPEMLASWRAPEGMTARIERFDPRIGGGYRVVLTYAEDTGQHGKSARARMWRRCGSWSWRRTSASSRRFADWASVMRARVGDVYMRWDPADKVPLFTAIPQCPAQDTESAQDFLTGRVQRRSLNVPPTTADCSQDGAGRGALLLARERMQAIATKIRTRAALTPEERQFVANVRTLPVYRMLEWGVRQGVVDSVIGDTDELVALTLAYQMLNDLTRTIDFAVSNAERGASAAGAADGNSANVCQTKILSKGIEQLRDLRDEVLRQRAQTRQSYMAALNAANLSASYAGLVRQRDRDARDAAGAAATRNQ
jgi:conjugative transfer pilus assembly protein TraH